MSRSWLLERMQGRADAEAIVADDVASSYADLLAEAERWNLGLDAAGAGPGRVVAFAGDQSRRAASLLLALLERGGVAVPLASATAAQRDTFQEIAQAEFFVGDDGSIVHRGERPGQPLIDALAADGRPGLVLFSSGSTGQPKAILHDLDRLVEKFLAPRPAARILSFLLLDHIGGINTLLHGLSHGGTVVCVKDRRPETVCRAIERHRVEVLPTSPTFLNLLLISGEHRRHDLSSLRLITYGTEPMPASTLERLGREFPEVRLRQTYGLSELGILSSQSRDDGSLWVKVGGEGYETKVVDDVLWIRARSAFLGYLNAPNPIDGEGWFNTQDAIERDGEWLRFLGRTSEIINVGGQKVYPAEVESVLLELDNVADATVRGEPNPIIGQCVVARVNLRAPEPAAAFTSRMRRFCRGRLAPYMIPMKVELVDSEQFNARCKRMRQA